MRFSWVLAGLLAVPAAGATSARADGCEEAWYQRNLIYKEAGYCFRTPRGIRAFGNAGCSYDAVEDVPLSGRQRQTVAELKSYERANGCPQYEAGRSIRAPFPGACSVSGMRPGTQREYCSRSVLTSAPEITSR